MQRDDDDDNYNDENSDWQRMSVAKTMMAVVKLTCKIVIFSDSDYFDELDDDLMSLIVIVTIHNNFLRFGLLHDCDFDNSQ